MFRLAGLQNTFSALSPMTRISAPAAGSFMTLRCASFQRKGSQRQHRGAMSRHKAKNITGKTGSSTRWLRRQATDPFAQKAKDEDMITRAAYKLQQIDDKYRFLKPGAIVLDLGSSPGGWSKLAYERVHPKSKALKEAGGGNEQNVGAVISVDLRGLQIVPMPRHGFHFIRSDFTLPETQAEIVKRLAGRQVDALLSDMHPPATGDRLTDHGAVMSLCQNALSFGEQVLKKNGVFLCKIIRGGGEDDWKKFLATKFTTVKSIKPVASRASSAEIYFFASGFRRDPSKPPLPVTAPPSPSIIPETPVSEVTAKSKTSKAAKVSKVSKAPKGKTRKSAQKKRSSAPPRKQKSK